MPERFGAEYLGGHSVAYSSTRAIGVSSIFAGATAVPKLTMVIDVLALPGRMMQIGPPYSSAA